MYAFYSCTLFTHVRFLLMSALHLFIIVYHCPFVNPASFLTSALSSVLSEFCPLLKVPYLLEYSVSFSKFRTSLGVLYLLQGFVPPPQRSEPSFSVSCLL